MVERRFPSRFLFHWNGDRRRKYHTRHDFPPQISSWRVVQIAAGEAKNPRRSLPKAIRGVYIRILLYGTSHFPLYCADHLCRFYICGVTVIGLLVPSNSPGLNLTEKTAAASPFVIAIKKAGIKGLPSLINACLLTSGASMSQSNCNRNF